MWKYEHGWAAIGGAGAVAGAGMGELTAEGGETETETEAESTQHGIRSDNPAQPPPALLLLLLPACCTSRLTLSANGYCPLTVTVVPSERVAVWGE